MLMITSQCVYNIVLYTMDPRLSDDLCTVIFVLLKVFSMASLHVSSGIV